MNVRKEFVCTSAQPETSRGVGATTSTDASTLDPSVAVTRPDAADDHATNSNSPSSLPSAMRSTAGTAPTLSVAARATSTPPDGPGAVSRTVKRRAAPTASVADVGSIDATLTRDVPTVTVDSTVAPSEATTRPAAAEDAAVKTNEAPSAPGGTVTTSGALPAPPVTASVTVTPGAGDLRDRVTVNVCAAPSESVTAVGLIRDTTSGSGGTYRK